MNEIVKTPFLRPNLQSQGEVPPEGELCLSPDIWCAGIHPMANFQEALATQESYGMLSVEPLVENKKNYFYVRCKNGSSELVEQLQVKLYYTRATIICWPSEWIEMDTDNSQATHINVIESIPAGEVGVVQAPFVWDFHTRPQTGDEYCFIAQLFSDLYPNPKPSVQKPIYIAAMLTNGLLWAEQNIRQMERNPDIPKLSYNFSLPIPAEATPDNDEYLIVVRMKGLGDVWDFEVQSSRTDSSGNQIGCEITHLGALNLVGQHTLLPGFYSQLTVILYNRTGAMPPSGSIVEVEVYNKILPKEVALAKQLKVYNYKQICTLRSLCNSEDDLDFNPILIGSYTALFR